MLLMMISSLWRIRRHSKSRDWKLGCSCLGTDRRWFCNALKAQKDQFLTQVRKSCKIGKRLRELGIRPNGIIRIDSSVDPETWAEDPIANTKLIAQTFREADIAADYGESLAAEGVVAGVECMVGNP